jgi:hypothetical protein
VSHTNATPDGRRVQALEDVSLRVGERQFVALLYALEKAGLERAERERPSVSSKSGSTPPNTRT